MIYGVGDGGSHRSFALLPTLGPGDIVEIRPGVHRELIRLKSSGAPGKPIVIRGVGPVSECVFDGAGLDASGAGSVPRALFQIEGSHVSVENLTLRNARNGHNAAGVRVTGATDFRLARCVVRECEMGMMSDRTDRARIEQCLFEKNGNPTRFAGYAHNLYLGGDWTTVLGCVIRNAVTGINFKTRGRYTELLYNRIEGSDEGEVSIVDGEDTKSSNRCHAVLIGNRIVSKADRSGNTSKFVDFGQDMGGPRNGTLFLLFNTLVAGDGRIRFVRLSSPGARLAAIGNEFSGSDRIAERVGTGGPITGDGNFGAGNVVDTKADALENWRDTWRVRNGSVSRKPVYIDADGIERDGFPTFFPPPGPKEGALPAALAPRGENNRAPGAG